MSEIDSTAPAQGAELDDFDVEGHGLKEIALGLSAATIVAGGAGATALAMDNPVPGTTSGAHAVIAGASADVESRRVWAQGMTDRMTDRAVGYVTETLRDVQQASDELTTMVTTTTSPVLEDVDATAKDAADLAQEAADDPIGTTDRIVDEAIVAARDARDQAVLTAKDAVATADKTAAAAVKTAEQTAADALVTAQQKADEATTLAGSTVVTVQQTVDPKADVETGEGGTTVQVGAAGVTVTVSTG